MDTCTHCGRAIEATAGGVGTGYALTPAGAKVCYACCAEMDKAYMIERGRIALYLTNIQEHRGFLGWRNGQWSGDVTNWPGTLRYANCNVKVGQHNWASRRYDVWFVGPDKHVWHGVRYGDMTEVVHCKRTKDYVGKQ